MSVERVEILVEEPSMEAALNHLLPRMLGGIDFEIFSFGSKSDLLSKLPTRMRGYASYLPDNWRVLVLVDRDDDDCLVLKRKLERAATAAGLATRSTGADGQFAVANRILVEELEAWYFGDWKAVCAAFPKVDPKWPRKAGFRDPDNIAGGTWEAFQRIAREAGYFTGGLRKVEAAQRIAPLISPDSNTSRSFQSFKQVIDEFVSG